MKNILISPNPIKYFDQLIGLTTAKAGRFTTSALQWRIIKCVDFSSERGGREPVAQCTKCTRATAVAVQQSSGQKYAFFSID